MRTRLLAAALLLTGWVGAAQGQNYAPAVVGTPSVHLGVFSFSNADGTTTALDSGVAAETQARINLGSSVCLLSGGTGCAITGGASVTGGLKADTFQATGATTLAAVSATSITGAPTATLGTTSTYVLSTTGNYSATGNITSTGGNLGVYSGKSLAFSANSTPQYWYCSGATCTGAGNWTQSGAWSFASIIAQPAAPAAGITLAAITAPASGAAPTGATQLTAATGRITSCPTNSAAQTTVSTGQSQSYVNACGASFMLYPVAGGTLGSQSTNTPLMIDAGMKFIIDGQSATAANIDVHMDFQWTDVSQPFTVPAMAAFTCSPPINITEAKAMVGDKVTTTGSSTIPTDNIAVSFEISVPSNGTLQLKACNIANTGLNNSTAISGATLNLLGTGSR